MTRHRFEVREDGQGGYGVWDTRLLVWADSALGEVGLDEGDAETLAAELNAWDVIL